VAAEVISIAAARDIVVAIKPERDLRESGWLLLKGHPLL
jgi:hypothetical protein